MIIRVRGLGSSSSKNIGSPDEHTSPLQTLKHTNNRDIKMEFVDAYSYSNFMTTTIRLSRQTSFCTFRCIRFMHSICCSIRIFQRIIWSASGSLKRSREKETTPCESFVNIHIDKLFCKHDICNVKTIIPITLELQM